MADFKTMYYGLFNRVSEAIGLLQEAQRETEELFTSGDGETDIRLFSDGEE